MKVWVVHVETRHWDSCIEVFSTEEGAGRRVRDFAAHSCYPENGCPDSETTDVAALVAHLSDRHEHSITMEEAEVDWGATAEARAARLGGPRGITLTRGDSK